MDNKNLYSQYKLLKHLDRLVSWQRDGFAYPILVGLNLTNSCNNKCPLCTSLRKDNATISLEDAKSVIGQLKEVDVRAIGLGGGGEPTCHPNLEEIIRLIKSKEMDVAVCSNGYKMSDGVIDAIVSCCSWMRISLDADCPETYRKTHGMDGNAFASVVNNMSRLAKKRDESKSDILIGATYLIGPHTLSGIYNAAKLCKDKGMDYIRFRPFFEWMQGDHLTAEEECLLSSELDKCDELSDDNFSFSYPEQRLESITSEKSPRRGICHVPHFIAAISADMKLYPCCVLRNNEKYCLGDLNKKSFKEIWCSERRKQVHSLINPKDCPVVCQYDSHNEILSALIGDIPHFNFL